MRNHVLQAEEDKSVHMTRVLMHCKRQKTKAYTWHLWSRTANRKIQKRTHDMHAHALQTTKAKSVHDMHAHARRQKKQRRTWHACSCTAGQKRQKRTHDMRAHALQTTGKASVCTSTVPFTKTAYKVMVSMQTRDKAEWIYCKVYVP